MEVKVEVKMDITPTFSFFPFTFSPFLIFPFYFFTHLPFKSIVQHEELNFLL